MESKKTRQSYRQKKISKNMRHVDEETRNYVQQYKIDALESDFYDSPNRLAEDNTSDDFDEDFGTANSGKKNASSKNKKPKKKIPKKKKKEAYVKRNFNLKKLIKEDNLEANTSVFPNFLTVRSHPSNYPGRKFCSICGLIAPYGCSRCRERYCSLKCQEIHRDIKCLNFDV